MRTAEQIYDEYDTDGKNEVIDMMKEYAREALQEFVSMETDGTGCVRIWQHDGAIGIRTDQDLLEKFKNKLK